MLALLLKLEKEMQRLQNEIVGDDEIKTNEAGEIIVQFDNMALKLRNDPVNDFV